MSTLISNPREGIMIPIPQYPLYSATICLSAAQEVHYFLNEEDRWSVSLEELERSYNEAKNKGINPKLITIINPGNPTGQVLSENSIK
jgi:aspartate/methionine/tyrosine aminotransferase